MPEKTQALKSKLVNRPKNYIPRKMSFLFFGFLSLLISVFLHLTYSHFLHKRAKLQRRLRFRLTHEERKIKRKPVQVVAINDYENLQERPEHAL